MYPKKSATNNTKSVQLGKNKLPEEKREKLLAIQQREQLKGLLVHKFIEKYGKDVNINSAIVDEEVANFIKNEKLTEGNLRKLEQRIKGQSLSHRQSIQHSNIQQSNTINDFQTVQDEPHIQENNKVNYAELTSNKQYNDEDAVSIASSNKPKSIYLLQQNDENEWATITKFDSELFKKEEEMKKISDLNLKRKMKEELDKQIEEKKRKKEQEEKEIKDYIKEEENQRLNFYEREKKKEEERKMKIMQEKLARDKQMIEELKRKKNEEKIQKEVDKLLVENIRREMEEEERLQIQKREEERQQLRVILKHSEEVKQKNLQAIKAMKESDVKQQYETLKLLDRAENDKFAEMKARSDRARKGITVFEESIVKEQLQKKLAEEEKQYKLQLEKLEKEKLDEENKKKKLYEMNLEVINYLEKQKQEKILRKIEESNCDKKQAELWKKDTEDYFENERRKLMTLKNINHSYANELVQQIQVQKGGSTLNRMNEEELLINKNKLKQIAEVDQNKFQKQIIS